MMLNLKLIKHKDGKWKTADSDNSAIPLKSRRYAPIDPMQLLNALNSHLSPQGGLSKIEDVPRLANVMKKFSRKLVSKCIYCNVLQSTQSEILEPYLAKGGWETINVWLKFAQGIPNTSFLMELLKLCRQLPMTVSRLKENNTAKIIKSLAKHENAEIKNISTEIVSKWMNIIKEAKVEVPDDKKKTKGKEKKDTEKKDKKENEKKEKEKKENEKKEKEKKEKERKDKNDKEKDKLHKQESKPENTKAIIPDTHIRRNSKEMSPKRLLEQQISALKLKGSKRASSEKAEYCEDVKIDPLDFLPPPKKPKPERPKTAKIYQKKFRSTGLEEEVVLPRKGSKKSVPAPAATEKSASVPLAKNTLRRQTTTTSPTAPEKKNRPENFAVPENSSKKGIQLIPAKPKPTYTLVESGGFMDALMCQPTPSPVRKRRKSKTLTSPTSPTLKPPKLQFYKDTLDMTEKKEEKEQPLSPKDQEEKTEIPCESTENAHQQSRTEAEVEIRPSPGGLKSILSYSRRKGRKKSVKWVADDKIKSVRYFDMDETERENVTKSQNFGDLKSIEQKREREIFELARRFVGPGTVKQFRRYRLIPLDILPPMIIPGCESNLKISEARRQLSVLQEIYFTPEMIPDSAAEPDTEISPHTEMKPLPLHGEFENVPYVMDNSTVDYPKLPTLSEDLMSKLQGITASLKFHQQNIQGPHEVMHDANKMMRGHDVNKMNRRPEMNQMMRGQDVNQMMRGQDMSQMHFNNDANRMMPSYESMPLSPSSPYDPGEPLGNVPPSMGPNNHVPPNMYGMPPNVMHNMPPDMPPNMMPPNDWNMEMPPPQHLMQGQPFFENYPPHMNQMMMPPQMNHEMMHNHMPQPGMNMRPPMMQQDNFQRPKIVRYRKVPCRNFKFGNCRFGDKCTFLHPGMDRQT